MSTQLQAYHDGQLAVGEREAFERHLAACGMCTDELARLRAMSRLFADAPRPRLSQIAAHRLQKRVEGTMQRGALQLARFLGAAAACVVLAGSLRLMQIKQAPQAAPPWVDVASVTDVDSASHDAGTPAARWYLADASHGSGFDNMP